VVETYMLPEVKKCFMVLWILVGPGLWLPVSMSFWHCSSQSRTESCSLSN